MSLTFSPRRRRDKAVRRHRLQNRAGLWLILTSDVILDQPPPLCDVREKSPSPWGYRWIKRETPRTAPCTAVRGERRSCSLGYAPRRPPTGCSFKGQYPSPPLPPSPAWFHLQGAHDHQSTPQCSPAAVGVLKGSARISIRPTPPQPFPGPDHGLISSVCRLQTEPPAALQLHYGFWNEEGVGVGTCIFTGCLVMLRPPRLKNHCCRQLG